MTDYNNYDDEQYSQEYSDEEDYSNKEHIDETSDQISDELGEKISSYNEEDISYEKLETIAEEIKNIIIDIKNHRLPPIDDEIGKINLDIDRKRLALEKAKKSSVLINDVSSDEVEFLYSDHQIRSIEETIKGLLNDRYQFEKEKFKLLEELEIFESRNTLCTYLLDSFSLRSQIDEILDYSEQVIDELYFNIEDYGSITASDEDMVDAWANNWNIVVQIIGRAEIYKNNLHELLSYFNTIKNRIEDKDPETKFVYHEMDLYEDLDNTIGNLRTQFENKLFSSIAALYEMTSNYEVGSDYLPENKSHSLLIISKFKGIILSIRSILDSHKLEYKDFRKSLNNLFILLNKAIQSIENQQKSLKIQQDSRVKKMRDIIALISRNTPESLRNSSNEINNMVNSLANLSASDSQIETIQYYFSIKAKYPVEEEAKDDLISNLNSELDRMNILEIDLMCKILGAKYDPKRGIFNDPNTNQVKATKNLAYTQNIELKENIVVEEINQPAETLNQTGSLLSMPKAKTTNLDFLGNMYMKEAQRSKGEWAAKSYLKAIDAFLKCAQTEEDNAKKQTFLKFALKCARDAVAQKESSETLIQYANCYKELADSHTGRISAEGLAKIGDNFVSAGRYFLREENINSAKESYLQANEYYQKAVGISATDEIKAKLANIQKFIK